MQSTTMFFFFIFKKERSLQHIVENEVSVLERLAFYENMLIGQETSVRISNKCKGFPGSNK